MSEFDEAAVRAWAGTVPGLAAPMRADLQQILAYDEYDGKDLVAAKPRRLWRLLGFARGFEHEDEGAAALEAVRVLLAARDVRIAADQAEVRRTSGGSTHHLAAEHPHARREAELPCRSRSLPVPTRAGWESTLAAAEAASQSELDAAVAEHTRAMAALQPPPGCEICFEPYSQAAGVVPRILIACGHTFCEGCLGRMLRPVPPVSNWKPLECPKCRTRCKVHGGRASALPTNYDIMGA